MEGKIYFEGATNQPLSYKFLPNGNWKTVKSVNRCPEVVKKFCVNFQQKEVQTFLIFFCINNEDEFPSTPRIQSSVMQLNIIQGKENIILCLTM